MNDPDRPELLQPIKCPHCQHTIPLIEKHMLQMMMHHICAVHGHNVNDLKKH